MDNLETISPQQAATRTGFSANTIKKWCRAGLLPSKLSPSKHFRIRPADLREFIDGLPDGKLAVNSVKSVNTENSH